MAVVFVCSDYSEDEQGRCESNARAFSEMEMALGNTPYSPVLQCPNDPDATLQQGVEMLQRCDELQAWGKVTHIMRRLIDEAEANGMPVEYMTEGE